MDPALALEIELVSKQRGVKELMARGDSEIQQFYKNAVVLITGASGFLGKQLMEKLLRSCQIKKIYILLRAKKQTSTKERIEKMYSEPVFELLRESQPNFTDKIEAVNGDVGELNLGLSDEVWAKLTEEVNIIFHSAATVNFNAPIQMATLVNVRGTREMLNFGKSCKNLRSYVHVSTAYSHVTKSRMNKQIKEKFYRSPIPPTTLIEFAENVEMDKLNNITSGLTEGWPNTYTFTKAVAEEAVRTMAGDLPVCIVRPAIVTGAIQEPSPGWIDMTNVFGPSGLYIGLGLGVLHVVNADENTQMDLVPVDYVNNAIIAAAHETAARRERGETDIKIYTVAPAKNGFLPRKSHNTLHDFANKYGTDRVLWHSFGFAAKNKILYLILYWFFHYIPAYIVDSVFYMIGKKRIAVKLYEKIYQVNRLYSYFLTNSFDFSIKNLLDMYKNMSERDQTLYPCNVCMIEWKQYLTIWCLGLRKYILKDGLNKTELGLKKKKFLRVAHYLFSALYVYTLYKIMCLIFWMFSSLISFVY